MKKIINLLTWLVIGLIIGVSVAEAFGQMIDNKAKQVFAGDYAEAVNITATVPETIYNTRNPKELSLKQLSICISEKDLSRIHTCGEEDYQCMTNVVSNICQ